MTKILARWYWRLKLWYWRKRRKIVSMNLSSHEEAFITAYRSGGKEAQKTVDEVLGVDNYKNRRYGK